MYNKQYNEHSTGDHFADSIAYGTEELGNPGVIHFYKQYREHISLEMLRMYQHIHRHCNKMNIPDLHTSVQYDGKTYNRIAFSILDLDPDAIHTACDIKTRQEHLITEPQYIEGIDVAMDIFYQKSDIYENFGTAIQEHISDFLEKNGILLGNPIDVKNNIKIVSMSGNSIDIIITDLGGEIPRLCLRNIIEMNKKIPYRDNITIERLEALQATLLGHHIDYISTV